MMRTDKIKKGFRSAGNVVLIVLVMVGMTGCKLLLPVRSGLGVINISVAASKAKTAHPFADESLMEAVSYEVTLKDPDGNEEVLAAGSDGIAQRHDAMPGTWLVSVSALNSEKTVLGRGSSSVEVIEGKVATVHIDIVPSGQGSMKFTISWAGNPLVEAGYVIKAYELAEDAEPVELTLVRDDAAKTAVYEGDAGGGSHDILVRMTDDSDKVLWGQREIFYVYEDTATNKLFKVLPEQMNRRPEVAPEIGAIERSPTRLAINWSSASPRADQYYIEKKVEPSGEWSQIAIIQYGTYRYIDSAVVQEATYSYRIKAGNSFGYSEWSAERQVSVPKVVSVFGANNTIKIDTTWTSDNSYSVENLLIEDGATLTIEKGTRVSFKVNPDPDTPPFYLRVDGALKVLGTVEEPVVFTTESNSPNFGSWGYIRFTDSSVDTEFDAEGNYQSGSILRNTVFEYADGLYIQHAAPYLDGVTLRSSNTLSITGDAGYGRTQKIRNLRLEGNGSNGSFTCTTTTPVEMERVKTINSGSIFLEGAIRVRNSSIEVSPYYYYGPSFNARGEITISDTSLRVGSSVYFNVGKFNIERTSFDNVYYGTSINNENGNTSVILTGCTFEGGGNSLLSVNNCNIQVKNTIFSGGSTGVSLNGVNGEFAYNTIKNASTQGMNISNTSKLSIHHNSFTNNAPGRYAISVSNSLTTKFIGNNLNNPGALRELRLVGLEDFSAGGNWWGTTNEESINLRIYDGYDTFDDGFASYQPFLMKAVEKEQIFVVSQDRYGKPSFSENPTVYWETIGGEVDRFKVQLSSSSDFTENLREIETDQTSWKFNGLSLGFEYYWRAAPIIDGVLGDYGPVCKMPLERLKFSDGYYQVFAYTDSMQFAWGNMYYGLLKNGSSSSYYEPQIFGWKNGFKEVKFSNYQKAMALKLDGSLYMWGQGANGQLGLGNGNDSWEPRKIAFTKKVIDFDGGNYSGYAVLADGTVKAWGTNGSGQLGDGTFEQRVSPISVKGLTDVQRIAAQGSHVLALKNDGSIWAWGNNGSYQCGSWNGGSIVEPVQVPLDLEVEDIDVSYAGSIALGKNGKVFVWGNTYYSNGATPVEVSDLNNIKEIKAGANHYLALDDLGQVWVWGENGSGQLGLGHSYSIGTPTKVNLPGPVYSIGTTSYSSYAVDDDGKVWAWGENGSGQLGDGTSSNRYSPVEIKLP